MMKKQTLLGISRWVGALCALAALAQSVNAQTVRLHGAVTLEKLLLEQKQALESQTGVKLEIVGNGAGRGLVDLGGGRADVAMIGGTLKGVAGAMNKEKAGSVDVTGMREIPLTRVKIALVTHAAVGVKSLTEAQARDVLTGKATNWKEVGGIDVPIKVVLPFAGDGSRITMQEVLLKDAEYAKTAIVRNSAKDVAVVLKQLAGSCSILSVKNVEPGLAIVTLDKDVELPMQLVVKGEPTGDVKKVVDAAKAGIK